MVKTENFIGPDIKLRSSNNLKNTTKTIDLSTLNRIVVARTQKKINCFEKGRKLTSKIIKVK